MQIQQKKFQKKTVAKLMTILGLSLSLGLTHHSSFADSIADTPLPMLPMLPGMTGPSKHVYSVPGVQSAPGVTTVISCTSTEKTGGEDIRWGIEVFENWNLKNDVAAGEGYQLLGPGDTDVTSLDDVAAFSVEVSLGMSVSAGSLRIIADSTKLICAAFLVDPIRNPPNFMTALPVIRRTTQKGQ